MSEFAEERKNNIIEQDVLHRKLQKSPKREVNATQEVAQRMMGEHTKSETK